MNSQQLLNGKRILVVVAHPDDELLGLGGTLHKIIRESGNHFAKESKERWENEGGSTKPTPVNIGTQVKVVILGEGLTSRADSRDTQKWDDALKNHQQNIEEARQVIGYHGLSIYQFPDNRFDSVPLLEIVKIVEKEKKSFDQDVILTHHSGDVNIDHQLTFQAVITATRPMEHERVQAVVTFETPSGTEWIPSTDARQFIPNLFIEVDEEDVQAKIDAMECYQYEKRAYPHPRSPEALKIRAQYWGMTVGKHFAEPFCVVRWIV